MTSLSTELFVIFLLLLANGFFALAEIAVVSARKARLKQLADEGKARAAVALATAISPTRFLSTVQIGITLIGYTNVAFSSETVGRKLDVLLAQVSWMPAFTREIAIALVVVVLTLGTVVLGELVPKRIALAYPERIAMWTAPILNKLAVVVSPVVALLSYLTEGFLRIFGLNKAPKDAPVSDEEVNILIEQGLHAGVFNKAEQEMVEGVLELDQMAVTAIMTPRPKIVFLNLDDTEEVNWRKIVASGHSYFPVYQGSRDHVLGMIAVKALWAHSAIGLKTNLKDLLVSPLVVPETMMAMHLLESFKKTGKHIALITDEFGAIQGLVTLIDVLEAIVGDLPAQDSREAPASKQREDGSWLIDATLTTGDLKSLLNIDELPHEEEADFQTLGGFMVTNFGRIPASGDFFEYAGWRFEIVDMDRHRVDKVLVSKVDAGAAEK
ncbi:putative hemolysin [Ereboglobus sp. PH5-10]|uniref:hemolysin family protein n=1 Tax=Ereboglobus sp. PH5-10 TaxID=2940629 RepID=UPI0024069658|nr:hemolysin family protein [Ereboglobus sp. PH5-10]MDF9826359.1 putative hemolysin [Ereboglobus sp. PH5-10]